jgi:hypothetical protein
VRKITEMNAHLFSPTIPSLGRSLLFFVAIVTIMVGTNLCAHSAEMLAGKLMSVSQVKAILPSVAVTGDDSYEVVNSKYMGKLQAEFVADLNRRGMNNHWERRFDCNKLATSFVNSAQVAFVVNNWNRDTGSALAIGEIWYHVNSKVSHAAIVAITERGLIFWDPQQAREIKLTDEQVRGAWLVKI